MNTTPKRRFSNGARRPGVDLPAQKVDETMWIKPMRPPVTITLAGPTSITLTDADQDELVGLDFDPWAQRMAERALRDARAGCGVA